jgi:hypothetical protein
VDGLTADGRCIAGIILRWVASFAPYVAYDLCSTRSRRRSPVRARAWSRPSRATATRWPSAASGRSAQRSSTARSRTSEAPSRSALPARASRSNRPSSAPRADRQAKLLADTFDRLLELPEAVVFVHEVEDIASITPRPGRFDYLLPVGLPNGDARASIWARYVDEITDEAVDIDVLVKASPLFTPADIEWAAARKAAQRAFERRSRPRWSRSSSRTRRGSRGRSA